MDREGVGSPSPLSFSPPQNGSLGSSRSPLPYQISPSTPPARRSASSRQNNILNPSLPAKSKGMCFVDVQTWLVILNEIICPVSLSLSRDVGPDTPATTDFNGRQKVRYLFDVCSLIVMLVIVRSGPVFCTRYSILDTRYSILDTRYSILDTRYSILDTRYSILDTRYSILDTRYSILDTRYSILDTRYSIPILDTRYSMSTTMTLALVWCDAACPKKSTHCRE